VYPNESQLVFTRGRLGNHTNIGTNDGTSILGSKYNDHLFKYIPFHPNKYVPLLKIRSLSSLFSNINAKKPQPKK